MHMQINRYMTHTHTCTDTHIYNNCILSEW